MSSDAAQEIPILHHVTFKTTQIQVMVDWYNLVVGCRVNFQFEGAAWTTNDAANHRVAFLTTPNIEDDPDNIKHSGLHHTAFEYPSIHGLVANYERLAKKGILPHICLDHGMTMSFYYEDPDGNSVELQCDSFGDWAKSTEYMQTSKEFQREPIGVEVDPPKLAVALASDASLADVLVRSRAGEFLPATPGNIRLPL